MDIYENFDADNECKNPKPDPKDPTKVKKPPFDDQPRTNQKIRAVASFDPNEMVGPKGFAEKNIVSKDIDFNYSIYFENKANATAPATEVLIVDTIDKNVFDLSTFNFKFVNFGDTTLFISQGGYQFSTDVDLGPQSPVLLRITAELDTATGIARWHYITLDTLNYEMNEDPDAGFLPPNVIAPQGEGIVGFVVKLKNTVTEESVIANKATIIFDSNPPIFTNKYQNVIDETKPVSFIDPIPILVSGASPIIPLHWGGLDDGSGISKYSILVSKNDEPYLPLIGLTKQTSVDYIGNPGTNYKFMCIAIDSVGNEELLTKSYDAQVFLPLSIDEAIVSEQSFKVSPNPVFDNLNVEFTTTQRAEVTISVVSQTGTVVFTQVQKLSSGSHIKNIDMSACKKGVYFVEILSEGQKRSKSVLKL